MPGVELQAFEAQRDLALAARWLRRAHVARWWGEPAQALAEVAAHDQRSAAMILLDGRPVGLLCWQVPSRAELVEAGLDDLPSDLVDIDVMIGEPDALGRSVGPCALRLLFGALRERGVRRVGLATALANTRALSAYARAGLVPYRDFVERGETYRYLTRDLEPIG